MAEIFQYFNNGEKKRRALRAAKMGKYIYSMKLKERKA